MFRNTGSVVKKAACAVFVLTLAIAPLARAGGFPALEADPRASVYARGAYSWQELGEIALWASAEAGNRDAPGGEASAADLLRRGVEELRASGPPADPRERGEFILDFMHRRFLKSYSARQTRLDQLLTAGRYNCVSSAVLYVILASSAGLEAAGVMTRDHAFVTVTAGAERIDVETTNRYGFDPGSRREFQDGFGRTTGFTYVPARNYRDRTSINQLELVSLILHNRIADAESRGRHAEAVSLALDRAALLSAGPLAADGAFFADPQKDLMDRLYNFGAALIRGGEEEAALRWAAYAGGRYPGGTRWQEMIFAALNNLLAKHVGAREVAEARDTLNLHAASLSADNLAKLDALVLDAELLRLTTQVRTAAEAQAAVRAIEEAGNRLPETRAAELRTFVLVKEGERLAAEQGLRAAIAYIEGVIEGYGGNPRLTNALRAYRSNRIAEFHNAFAGLYNRGDYEEARRVIQEALEEFPGNSRLQADLTTAERALRRR
jgi:tetratricopeptide (TPR) repeat protein